MFAENCIVVTTLLNQSVSYYTFFALFKKNMLYHYLAPRGNYSRLSYNHNLTGLNHCDVI